MDINKRFDRILAILVQLQSKKVVTAQELAARFEVSLRTIYRDIRSLELAGIPVYSEVGVGYSLVDGFRMRPVLFTKEEALSFGVAEKLMSTYLDKNLSGQFSSALYKMKAMLRTTDKAVVSTVESKVLVRSKTELFNQEVPEGLSLLFEGISVRLCLSITYQSVEALMPSVRLVEPVGVFHENGFWYFVAYCHLRLDYRQFRLDRVHQVDLTEKPFERQHKSLEFYLEKQQQDLASLVKVRISVDQDVVKHLKWERDYFGFHSEIEKGDQVEMTFMCTNLNNGFARWYMMFGDKAKILEPESLRETVRAFISENLKNIDQLKS
ncbi:YafY family protein [Flavobacterium sp. NKUCC04_CG]|uniref:helix-turn-helix transcriptional regulator n=1 Tax=Flavobacterium sp. NKUCC04_CG TaxID=2842121 RepID=UPI001C5BA509|nr:YafY family protein [Flavobacterium sp. NKUCC04_CG]MBW3519305.1 YafY family transcriptional regulator [Flavobacterium sp. NKUCC04_CG]